MREKTCYLGDGYHYIAQVVVFYSMGHRNVYTIPYSGEFLLAQHFAEMRSVSSEKIFRSFYFCRTNVWCSDHTTTSWWPGLTCKPKKWPWTMKREESLCNSGLVFLCVEAFATRKLSARTGSVGEKLACCAALLISTSTTSVRLVRVSWHFVYIVADSFL